MNTNDPDLATLWAQHLTKAFPRGRPETELGGQDIMDLVELDTFLAGYISQLASQRQLTNPDVERFNEMKIELERAVLSLQGPTATYFQSLLTAASVAARHGKPAGE